MAGRLDPTPEVARARQYAARVRIALAALGALLLVLDPGMTAHPVPVAIGFAVIGATGVVEWLVPSERWLSLEEALSCVAVICMVGLNEQVGVISVLWLVAAASGVLARGGRVAGVGRIVVVGTLFSLLVTRGMSAETFGFACAAIALLLVTGRVSRETNELLRRARHDAAHDPLTGLLSRGAFRVELDRLSAMATSELPAAVIAIDLDDFGAVNKRFGHAAGDRRLRLAAERMRAALRDEDVLGRLGGDEFAAVIVGGDPLPVARRLVDAAGSAAEGSTSACAGTAAAPRDGSTAEALLAAADVALRVAKRVGKGQVGAYDGAPISSSDSDGARAALERLCRGEGLRMATQPIVDLSTGRVHAYEALARFSTRGGQGPLHWFALAEELGLRAELELACLQASLALTGDLPSGTRLSVNLSAPMLEDPRAAELLASCPALARLIIEVTEETLVRHQPAIEETVGRLLRRGVLFAVDDVGSGYSGLSQLATLRPTYVKLDRDLVRDIDSEPARVALVSALADYARSTGGLLVAEGVETPAELDHVRAAGAPLVQGYLLARPADPWPAVKIEALRPRPVAVAG